MRIGIVVVAVVAGLLTRQAHAQSPTSTTSWPTASPQSVGLNAAVLDSLDAEIRAGKYGYVDRMLVIRHGKVAYDRSYPHDYDKAYADSVNVNGPLNSHDVTSPYNYYDAWWHPYYRRGDLHSLQSVTKTATSMIIGVAVTRGDFPSIDRPVLSFFDTSKVANVDDRKRRMTVRNVLTMTAGFDWNENLPYSNPANTATSLEESADWVKFTIDRPMAAEPGTTFRYNSGASALLAYVFRRATGTDIEEYAAKNLFGPLGITRWFWKRGPTGLADTEGGLYLEAGDLAKIWSLVLHDGKWNDRQIVSPEWVHTSITPAIRTAPAPTAPEYGLSWWLYPNPRPGARPYWAGSGFGGQFPVAFPDDDMIVVFNAWNILPGKAHLLLPQTLARLSAAVIDRRP